MAFTISSVVLSAVTRKTDNNSSFGALDGCFNCLDRMTPQKKFLLPGLVLDIILLAGAISIAAGAFPELSSTWTEASTIVAIVEGSIMLPALIPAMTALAALVALVSQLKNR